MRTPLVEILEASFQDIKGSIPRRVLDEFSYQIKDGRRDIVLGGSVVIIEENCRQICRISRKVLIE